MLTEKDESTCFRARHGFQWLTKCGMVHRLDGPAIISDSGYTVWSQYGLRHREDGPALMRGCGSTEWWIHGKQHRIDGPAVDDGYGNVEYWVNDIEYADVLTYWMAVAEWKKKNGT